MATAYLWIKSLHIIAVICWMAGLLYVYRLFIYHRIESHSVCIERFQLMERRLWSVITVPSAWVALLSGVGMLAMNHCLLAQGWMQLKLILLLLLFHVHIKAGLYRKRLLADPNYSTEKTLRIMNEIPSIIILLVVPLVVIKPFWWSFGAC